MTQWYNTAYKEDKVSNIRSTELQQGVKERNILTLTSLSIRLGPETDMAARPPSPRDSHLINKW